MGSVPKSQEPKSGARSQKRNGRGPQHYNCSMPVQATYDDANLILRLYELRREEKLRQAREWFAQKFVAPEKPEDLMKILDG